MPVIYTEIELWEKLIETLKCPIPADGHAIHYKSLDGREDKYYGLCGLVASAFDAEKIDYKTYFEVSRKIKTYSRLYDIAGYKWPITMEGNASRIAFCEEQIKQLKGE